MDKKDNKGVCMACSCPCDEHKEHTHGGGHDHGGDHNNEGHHSVCMACSCPCDKHKKHNHE